MRTLALATLFLTLCTSCAQTNSLRPFPTGRLSHLVGMPYDQLRANLGEPHRKFKSGSNFTVGWYANYGGPLSTPAVMNNQNCQFFFDIGQDNTVVAVDMTGDSLTCDSFIDRNRKPFAIPKP